MARHYCLEAENCLYHIIGRADDRKKIYIIPSDYVKFMMAVKVLRRRLQTRMKVDRIAREKYDKAEQWLRDLFRLPLIPHCTAVSYANS